MYYNNNNKNYEDLNSIANKISNGRYNNIFDIVILINKYKEIDIYNTKMKLNNENYLIKTVIKPTINSMYLKYVSEILNFLKNRVHNNKSIIENLIKEILKEKKEIYSDKINILYLVYLNNMLINNKIQLNLDKNILKNIIDSKDFSKQHKINKYQIISNIDNIGNTIDILDINSDNIIYYLTASKYLLHDNLTEKDILLTEKLINKDKYLFIKILLNENIISNINEKTLIYLFNNFLIKDQELLDNILYIIFITEIYKSQKSLSKALEQIFLLNNKNIFTKPKNIYFDIFTAIFNNKIDYIIKNIDFIKDTLSTQKIESINLTDIEQYNYLKYYKNRDFTKLFSDIKFIKMLCSDKNREIYTIIEKLDSTPFQKNRDR